jgi:tetratricopeptide (TPR) repeat protein
MIVWTTAAVANDIDDCNQTADADRRIKGCTALLMSAYEAYLNRGAAYYDKGEYDKSIADNNRAIELNPNNEGAYNNRGNAYNDKGEYDKAIADYNRAIELNPNNEWPYNGRGNGYLAKGEVDKAIDDFNRATKLNPNYELPYLNRGNAYKAKSEYGKAIADYNRAIELNPKDANALRQLGVARFNTGDFKAASAGLLRSLELKDGIYAMLYRYLARARAGETLAAAELEVNSGRLKTKEWPYAVIEFYLGKRSLELTLDAAEKPTEKCEAQFYIGEWSVLQNKSAEAQAALEKAAGTCPKSFIEYASAQAELKRLKP